MSVNSTRKAKWHAKLGYANPPTQLRVKLDSIKPNSTVGAVDVVVERVYPILFMEKRPDGSKVYRNQRQEELIDYKYQMDMYNDMDEGKFKQSASCNQAPLARANNKRNVCQLLKIRLIDYCERNVTPKTSNHIFFSKFFAKRKKLINKLKRLNVSNRVAKRERAKRKAKRGTTSCHFKFVSHKSKVSANCFSKFDLTKNNN